MRQFGLIGFPLSHSFSQQYFTKKFSQEGITDCVYQNFPLQSIDALPEVLHQQPALQGLNVTIPYKQSVISFLDDRSHLPLNACNCIRVINKKLIGYNTDVTGFQQTLLPGLRPEHRRALVLGRGGASEAVHYVLGILGIESTIVSRRAVPGDGLQYNELTRDTIDDHLLIINTTPVGMYPRVDEAPDIPYQYITPHHYLFDLIYNPEMTVFLQKGADKGATVKNGSAMLVIQAEESWRIWNS